MILCSCFDYDIAAQIAELPICRVIVLFVRETIGSGSIESRAVKHNERDRFHSALRSAFRHILRYGENVRSGLAKIAAFGKGAGHPAIIRVLPEFLNCG